MIPVSLSPVDPGGYLLAQFDAICVFETKAESLGLRATAHALKVSYARGRLDEIRHHDPRLIEVFQELEKVVPTDHRFWEQLGRL